MLQWAIESPGRMFERDCHGRTVLLAAVRMGSAALVAWLIDDQGVSIHGHCPQPKQLLHFARGVSVMNVLLARGADPTVLLADGLTSSCGMSCEETLHVSRSSWKTGGYPLTQRSKGTE